MSRFDAIAHEWDNKKSRRAMAQTFANALNARFDFKDRCVLDLGCGTGSVALALEGPAHVVGVDSSRNMLLEFEKKIPQEAREGYTLKCIDLESEGFDEGFDSLVSTMCFHHIKETKDALLKIYSALGSGGEIGVIDLDSESGDFHDSGNTGVMHFGFEREALRGICEEIGYRDIEFFDVAKIDKNSKTYTIFLLKAKK